MATTQQPISIESVSHVTLVVEDQDEALDWFMEMLDFEKRDDEAFETPDGKAGRWLTVSPKSGEGTVEVLHERGVTITEEPVEYPWGISAMIPDPFGNGFHLMEYGKM